MSDGDRDMDGAVEKETRVVPDDEGVALLLGDTAALVVVEAERDADGAGDEDAVMDVTTPVPAEEEPVITQHTYSVSVSCCDGAITIQLTSAVSSRR